MARPTSCNILTSEPSGLQLRSFQLGRGKAKARQVLQGSTEWLLPRKLVSKSWQDLWNPRLNVAWWKSDRMHIQVLELPDCEPEELEPMIELQLEKLCPIPVAQAIWTALPIGEGKMEDGLQSIIVLIAPRHALEGWLNSLEESGFIADRIEAPLIRELESMTFDADGVWLLPLSEGTGDNTAKALAAWHYGGRLRSLNLVHVSPDQALEELKQALENQVWSGEMAGWLESPPQVCLVGDGTSNPFWHQVLQSLEGFEKRCIPRTDPAEVATHAATELSTHSEAPGNLLPRDYRERYRQKFVDAIWFQGLLAMCMLYLVGLGIYFGALQWNQLKLARLQGELAAMTPEYDKARSLEARIQVIHEQSRLRFAALDSLRIASQLLPEGLILESFGFQSGETLILSGSGPAGLIGRVADYNEALVQYRDESGIPFFSRVDPPNSSIRNGNIDWRFTCELRKEDL